MTSTVYVHFMFIFFSTTLYCTWPSSALGQTSGPGAYEMGFTSADHGKQVFTDNALASSTVSTNTGADVNTGIGQNVQTESTDHGSLQGRSGNDVNDFPRAGVTDNIISDTRAGGGMTSPGVPASSTMERATIVDSETNKVSSASGSVDTTTPTSTESSSSITGKTTANSSSQETRQCHEMCHCPQYQGWANHLAPYLRHQLGSSAEKYTDYVLKVFLLQQFAVNAESLETTLGRLFETVMAEGNTGRTLSLWWTRFGITMCSLDSNTTFYLDAAAEARLFPQVGFKQAYKDLVPDSQTGQTPGYVDAKTVKSPEQGWEQYQLYNITFMCKPGARVVLTEETSLGRYGRWKSTGCQVGTEGSMVLDKNWSLVELALTNENALWFQNITVSGTEDSAGVDGLENNKGESNVQPRNDSAALNSSLETPKLKRDTVFPSIQEVSLTNTSLSLQQLSQVLVWFQKAKSLSLQNNSLANFSCSQLIPAPATWNSLTISFSHLTYVPACTLRTSLVTLDLSSNSISNISVFHFPRYVPSQGLETLNLNNNSITDVGIFTDVKNLTFLFLARNQISYLNKLSFTRLGELSVLDLSYNLLHTLDAGSFKYLFFLQILDLQHNYLQRFDRTVSPLRLKPPLDCKVDLSHNRFSHPPFQRDDYNPGVGIFVHAAANPFACDCAMTSYVDATSNSSLKASYSDRSDLQCVYPSSLKGLALDDVVFTDTCPVVSDCPAGCTCTLFNEESTVTVDCSSVEHFLSPQTFPNTHNLRLEFQSENKTQTFTTFEDGEYLQRVVSINVSGRGVTQVPDFLCEALKQAEVFDLSFNKLRRLPPCFHSRPKHWPALEMRLAHNPWSCDCDGEDLGSWLADLMDGAVKNGVRVSDALDVWCSDDTDPGVRVGEWDASHCHPISYLPWVVSLGVVLGLAAVLGPLLYVYRLQAMVTLHARFHIRPFTRVHHYNEDDFDYEALVVHGASNAAVQWVLNTLLPRTNDARHRLCVPERDFLLGSSLADVYASSVARSKATLCVLSQNAVRDEWWLYAFHLARAENARHPHKKFLLVLLEEHANVADLPEEVHDLIKTSTYLSVEDNWFWKKLFYYLPDPPKVHLLN